MSTFVVVQVVVVRWTTTAGDLPVAFDLPALDHTGAGALHTVVCDEDDGFAPVEKVAPIETLPAIAGRATMREAGDGAIDVRIARRRGRLFARGRHFTLARGEWGRHVYNGRHKGVERWNEQVTVSIAATGDAAVDRELFHTGIPARLVDQRSKL